ncbi:MAG: hypothetical protein JWL84_3264 [Rhodospirillales bacterium]|nr:hypothetical protein [Rhodospirillales bacterium]
MHMTISMDAGYQTITINARRASRFEWFRTVAMWSDAAGNAKMPMDSHTAGIAVMLNPGKFLNFVDHWHDNNISVVFFKFLISDPLDMTIDALVGSSFYLISDPANFVDGLNADGTPNLKRIAKGTYRKAGPVSQVAPMVDVTQAQVATLVASAGSMLSQAGGNVAAALERLQMAAASAALKAGVGRTAAALDSLVKISAQAKR